jgi:hypothetical protein
MEPDPPVGRLTLVRELRALSGVALICCLAACGADRPTALESPSPTADPIPATLTCPDGEFVWSEGGLLAEPIPPGHPTREAAVEAWLATAPPRFSRDYVIAADGKAAWLLRKNGTAETKLRFLHHNGFTVHGYDSCT